MNRKKISIKGALLALAVSLPPLISTTVFTVPTQQSINQTKGLIDQTKTFTSLSEPSNKVDQDLSVINYDLTQVEPLTDSLAQIKPFKWINYRTRSQVETQIHDLIVEKTKQNLVELNKDYQIVFTTNVGADEVVPVQTVKVKAMTNSTYLTGEFSFEIINGPLKVGKNRPSFEYALINNEYWEEGYKALVLSDINEEFTKQNIDENANRFISLLKIVPAGSDYNSSIYWPLKYDGQNYYKKIVFKFESNKLFSSDLIIWDNIVPPKYKDSDIPHVEVNQAYSLSFVDSTGDQDYPHANDPDVYINSNHYPARESYQYSPTITFAEIDVKKMFGFSNVDDFFKMYNLNFNYQMKLNTWTSNLGWNVANGKAMDWHVDNAIWTNKGAYDLWSTGSIYSGRKAYAEAFIYVEYAGTIIKAKGRTGTAFDWANGSWIHHAAFGLLKGNSLKIEPKKL